MGANHKILKLASYRFINSNNRRALTYSLAINHLTDLSDDELKVMRGYRHTKGAKGGIEFTSDVDVSLIPDTLDWRLQGIIYHGIFVISQ